jgi:hypothetical protein
MTTALVPAHSPGEYGTMLSARFWDMKAAIWALVVVEWAVTSSRYPGRIDAMREAHRAMMACRKWADDDRRMSQIGG